MWKYEFMFLSLWLLLLSMSLSKSWKISNLIENQCFSIFHSLTKLNLDENLSNFWSINTLTINLHIYHTHNHTLCQSIFCLVNDLLKIITATERASLISLISQSANQLISHNFQLQSNFWWSLLAQQLHQSHSQSIQTSDKKSTFIMIKINMNRSLKIDYNHSILLNHIMLWKTSILMTRIFIMLTQIKLMIFKLLY